MRNRVLSVSEVQREIILNQFLKIQNSIASAFIFYYPGIVGGNQKLRLIHNGFVNNLSVFDWCL